ncbi:MAG: hypothetical protein SynsKO_38260 [Synoicihabitans sp.]
MTTFLKNTGLPLVLGGVLFLFSLSLQAESESVEAYDAPDQAMWHAPSKTWFISNLGGGISLERDNDGWITRTDAAGNIIEPFWIGKKEGMHAPSGMIITDDFLYACDRDGVYEIDIAHRQIANFWPTPGGEFINDIAMDSNGDLYVSDFFGNRIYKLPVATRKAEVWLETDDLQTPDGLLIDGGKLIVAAWGPLSDPATFATSKPGDLLSIDLKTKRITTLVPNLGNLEGITRAGDHYYITDWAAGTLIEVHSRKLTSRVLISGLSHPTDPGFAKELGVLAFPQHGTNQVLHLDLGKP